MQIIKAVIVDFGGVLAEEGFSNGLKTIAIQNKLNPDDFFLTANELVYKTGYITGTSDESTFWTALREKTGIIGTDQELREEILKRFIIRDKIIQLVRKLKSSGIITAILSDQTNWLDEINQKTPFFHYVDRVFNSFTLKKDKKDLSVFIDVCSSLGYKPEEVLFVDDNIENVKRAKSMGLHVIHFRDTKSFEKEIIKFIKNY